MKKYLLFVSFLVLSPIGFAHVGELDADEFPVRQDPPPRLLSCSQEERKNSDLWHWVCAPSLSVVDCDDAAQTFFTAYSKYFGLKQYPQPVLLQSDTRQFTYESIKGERRDGSLDGFVITVREDRSSCSGLSVQRL